MSVTSLEFLVFSIGVAALCRVWSNVTWQNLVMLCANMAFISSFTTSFKTLLPFGGFLVWGYLSVYVARFDRSRLTTVFFVISTLAIFCWLKKYWFLSFVGFLNHPYLGIGLSYAFFRVMGTVIDARTDSAAARVGPVSFFNFAMNFPTMVAGPIDRFQNFTQPARHVGLTDIALAAQRIAIGFLKVLVLSSIILQVQSQATTDLLNGGTGLVTTWPSIVSFGLYPVFLYFNFSGYTDIVIGVGYLFGKTYPENFDAPFSSFNFLEFWSRWHMSLSFWLRDYVYTPLLRLMMQADLPRSMDPYLGVGAYFVTFFLIGIWHGSTVIFAIYGLLLALGVSVNKLYQTIMAQRLGKRQYKELSSGIAYKFIARGLTYTWYSFCMICFWNSSVMALKLYEKLGLAGATISFLTLLAVVTVLLNLFEVSASMLRKFVWVGSFSDYMLYFRAIGFAIVIFLCMANAIISHKIDAGIIYQAF